MNTILPSTQRVHSMSTVKDPVNSMSERSTKKPLGFTARNNESRQPIEHVLADHSSHVNDGNDSIPHALSNQSRHSWTHSAFKRFTVVTESNDRGQQLLQPHTFASSGLSLAGVCTVRIGPHLFIDTKFYTVFSPPIITTSNRSSADKPENDQQLHHQTPNNTKPQHRVVMEFKENPGSTWIFPDSSIEFIPADDREPAQITASFRFPFSDIPDPPSLKSRHDSSRSLVTMIIQRPTTALREGLELAIKGSLDKPKITSTTTVTAATIPPNSTTATPTISTTTTTTTTTASTNVTSRRQNLSTYSEEPSEILGSRRQLTNGNGATNATNSSKRKAEIVVKSKSKRPRNEDKVSHTKKSTGTGSKKSNAAGASSTPTPQKHCGYCGCTSTPMWRRGPNGPSTLCNACGVKWKHGKILQDANDTSLPQKSSPTSNISIQGSEPSTSNNHSSNLKAAKEFSNAASSKHADEKGSHKINGRQPNHNESNEKSVSRVNGGSKGERMIPVKKRLLGKTPANPPGPRMVPVHELGDPTKTPSKFPPFSRKHGHDNEPVMSNGRTKYSRNGNGRNNDTFNSNNSAETNDYDQDPDNRMETSATSISEERVSLYSKNRYTNNTATFPLHFPTISIAFGPNNAKFTYPNCAVALYENHFQIKLKQDGERTEIDVWKEGIEGTEFETVDGDGENIIILRALLRQYLTRFDKDLLNPHKNESLIVFRFRERLDGGGPSVKPLLEHWLATDIPVPPSS